MIKKILALTLVISTLFSCNEKEEDPIEIGVVNFATDKIIETEAATQPLIINLGINSYYHQGGTVHIDVTGANYGTDYTLSTGSSSFDLEIKPGKLISTFSITTLNNVLVEGSKNLTFTITSATGGLQVGNNNTFQFTILDDDVPTIGTVNFAQANHSIAENSTTPLTVNIDFNQISTFGGTINIAATGSAVFGTHYTIAGQNSSNFSVVVPPYSNSASFTLTPINDSVLTLYKNATFTITGVTGALQFQSPFTTTVSISDDEFVPTPINYVETFEGYTTGSTYLTTLGYTTQNLSTSGITATFGANTNVGNYADVNNVLATSDKGVNLFYNAGSPATGTLGLLDQVLISPVMNGTGNITLSFDLRYGFLSQNNANVKFYYSETYTGGTFDPNQWTEIGSETAQDISNGGVSTSQYKRKTMSISPYQNFRFAIRVSQNISQTNYRTQWRFDNFKVTSN